MKSSSAPESQRRRSAFDRSDEVLRAVSRLRRAERDLIDLACEMQRADEDGVLGDAERVLFEFLRRFSLSPLLDSDRTRDRDMIAGAARFIRYQFRPSAKVIDLATRRARTGA